MISEYELWMSVWRASKTLLIEYTIFNYLYLFLPFCEHLERNNWVNNINVIFVFFFINVRSKTEWFSIRNIISTNIQCIFLRVSWRRKANLFDYKWFPMIVFPLVYVVASAKWIICEFHIFYWILVVRKISVFGNDHATSRNLQMFREAFTTCEFLEFR